ncbi:ADP-ribose pyrophosphatase [Secundilactobacillus pentosiphilus]|uniref:ADP-ribose pyrophosphatase n=1 Tax=Secundilactobacillus pentosiphilus TaxID=1714682 RepID=A0A1Z5IQT7_9LACO|nr:NUDIX domain-containing protein [Secundilactobacillus pentosiphilus]GAX03962.1 ADP-ribose pyrophosphatase [Secundilactobacillus pentosiphilus]
MANYIKELRALVGHQPLILNSASGALLNQHQQVLLQERTDTGNWGFPGGYLAFGESFKNALVREFQEDAGLVVQPLQLLQLSDQLQYTYPNGDQVQPINCFYLVTYVSGSLLQQVTNETTRLAYFDLNQPPTFFNEQHAAMFSVLQQHYS